MPVKPTLFAVTDIETTLKHRIAFDVAWRWIDRRGKEYAKGSYLIEEAFKYDVPYFKEKLGFYFKDTFEHYIQPLSMAYIRILFNEQLNDFRSDGHNLVFAAYNAAFDTKYLGKTCQKILKMPFLDSQLNMLDIWHYWALSVPMNYKAPLTASGKFYSTSAESVFQYENQDPNFEERHIAFSDVEIESKILLKVLARKKKMPIVSHPKNFASGVYRLANLRLGVDGTTPLPIAT